MKPENQNEKAQANSTQEKIKAIKADVYLLRSFWGISDRKGSVTYQDWQVLPNDKRPTEFYKSYAFARLRAQDLAAKSGGRVIEYS